MTQKALILYPRPTEFHGEPNPKTDIWMRMCLHGGMHPGEGTIQNRRSNGRHVMLVQSVAIELQAVAEMISALGYRVTPVEESGKALLCFDREPSEVVISDLDMPQINGYQLARHIRKRSPHTRILLMTACCQAEVVDYMDDRVVDGWLFKPFGMNELKDMLVSVKYSAQEEGWMI